jgi:predicted nucleotidyltransferase
MIGNIGAPYPIERDTATTLAREALGDAGMILYAAVVGSHAEGYAAPDSDVDVRGIFVYPTARYLGLHPPLDEVRLSKASGGVQYDVVLWEVGKWAKMVEAKRGNAAELLWSPLWLIDHGNAACHLRAATWATFCHHWAFHYLGHARTCYTAMLRRDDAAGTVTVRLASFLRAVRLLLGALYLLEHGSIVVELPDLLAQQPYSKHWVYASIKRVRQDADASVTYTEIETARHVEYLRELLAAVEGCAPDWLPERMPEAARAGLDQIVTFYRAEPGDLCTAAWQAFVATQVEVEAARLAHREGAQARGEVADGGVVPGGGGVADQVG